MQKNSNLISKQSSLYAQWVKELKEEPCETQDFFALETSDNFVRFYLFLLEKTSPYLLRLFFAQKSFVMLTIRNGFDETYSSLLKQSFASLYTLSDFDIASKELRLLKKKAALLIALADISGQWNLNQVTHALSVLAEMCLRVAVNTVLRIQFNKGVLNLKDDKDLEKDCGLFVIAMGKLGAKELNYSSDIDLIILYDDEKIPYTGKKEKGTFAVRLTQEIISLMDDKTPYGYVFRTDMRLRPDPGSTPVALSTVAASCYYESFAQNWERAAFIKARVVAGDRAVGNMFLKEIRPFIWRRTTDFYALKQIGDIKKSLGLRSLENKDKSGFNIKLGAGGIREIEFFTQLQQLLWGGRDNSLRSKSTLVALKALFKAGWISLEDKEKLDSAYVFLRTLEHRLQMVEDQQTQTLPKTSAELESLAVFSGFDNYNQLLESLNYHSGIVRGLYDSLFAEKMTQETNEFSFAGADLPEQTADKLTALGFDNNEEIGQCVRGWFSGRYKSLRTERAREIMNDLLPLIFNALSKNQNPYQSFLAFDDFLKGLPSGVQLFSLFKSRPALIDLLADIIGNAPALSLELTRRPELFDTLLSPTFFEAFPSKEELQMQAQNIVDLTEDDELALDAMRRFLREKKFGAGLLFLQGIIEKQDISFILSNLATAVLNVVCPIVLRAFEKQYGTFENAEFSFVLLGKAGSQEMSFSSDLDILFVYNVPDGQVSINGKSALTPSVYYARLTQRIVNALTMNTKEGLFWPIDMRLRPSGNAGPVAVSFKAFSEYYQKDAWVWEFMALTKARVVWGNSTKIEDEIKKLLCFARDGKKIQTEIKEMRQKIAEQFSSNTNKIKYGKGCMVDIEFSVQYLQLIYANQYPDLLQKAVLPVLDKALEHQLISIENHKALSEAYLLCLLLSAIISLCLNQPESSFDKIPTNVLKVILSFCHVKDLKELNALFESRTGDSFYNRLF